VEKLPELKIISLSIDKLIPYTRNARTHSEKQIKKIASSIQEFGFNDPIAIDLNNGIIAGHGRLEAAKLLGLSEVPTIQLGHLSAQKQKAYILAHNRIALDAGWDHDLLKIELLELKDAGFDLELTAFGKDEIELFTSIDDHSMGLVDDDEVPAITVNPFTKLGDVWILGNHRLICGDSTNPQTVENLMNGENPNIMVTDPPYGVNYDPEWRDHANLGVGEKSLGKVENDDLIEWTDVYSLFTGDVAYVWHAGKFTHLVAKNLIDCGFEIVSQIIWAKNNFAISRGDYHWKHEPCWYVVKKGSKHSWQGARDQSTLWEINNTHQEGDDKKVGHGTQKPMDCMLRPILNNTKVDEYVYDPFGGSGTTLIACEKTNRKCLMMEISPAYCDVIINRWQKFTGKKATHEQSGLSFEEITNGKHIDTYNA